MSVKLEKSPADPSLRGGRVARWSKRVGDRIGFREDICVVGLDDFAALRWTGRGMLLAGRRRLGLKSDLEARADQVFGEIAITSSDHDVSRKTIKDQRDQAVITDTTAVVASHDHGELSQEYEWAQAPAMCVVANPVGGDQDFEKGDRCLYQSR